MTNGINIDRRALLTAAAALPVAAALPAWASSEEERIVNPLVLQRADPHILRHDDWFYFTASVPEYDRVVLRRARSVADLRDAEEVVLWRRPESGRMGGYIWAPEIHYFDGRWHIYFAAGNEDDPFHIRTYVLQAEGANPLAADWSVIGQLETPWDSFTLDCTSFEHKGQRYLCWAQREPGIDTNSNLYLAPMATPTTLAAAPARLTVPTLPWEIQGYKVAEGAALLARNGKLFLTYSGSATDDRYCMGMLTADAEADIMDPAAWAKSPVPVFESAPEHSIYGPGHNSFVVDEAGRDLLVYHARDYREIDGNPLFDPNRHARVQPIHYRADGTPDFGKPVANGPLPQG
ncbi:family 43 glycosylhydrolase [Sphingosinithalassobacter sp. CS137]|uniref:glycoside hydrolase family 43 protein n=1 Tax=Sphingosinithalassobacter sp. CS137 TaxID=2762748 RepID=UPI00165EB51B|nr:glycoside hydrolase family 43 protein [Sphingosinithalassobacter sp. CS137]